jgi:hypothetical protein
MNICGWQPYQASILRTIWLSIFTSTMETWRHIKINYVQGDHNLKSFADSITFAKKHFLSWTVSDLDSFIKHGLSL